MHHPPYKMDVKFLSFQARSHDVGWGLLLVDLVTNTPTC
jgi:hypothetical protein